MGDDDAYEPDDSPAEATPITVNGAAQSHTFTLDDQDWISFDVTSTTATYVMETSNLSTSCDTYMYLYDTNGITVLDQNDDYIDLESRITRIFSSTGTYYIVVEHFSYPSGIGDYDVEVYTQ